MAKEKIWPHPLAPVWLNLEDPQGHTIGISNFFVCLFQGWQCTWIISKLSHLNALGPLEPLEWPKKRFGLIH